MCNNSKASEMASEAEILIIPQCVKSPISCKCNVNRKDGPVTESDKMCEHIGMLHPH